MNYYESVVIDYLRADRAVFANTEHCLQLKANMNPDKSGPHWYCDALALDFRYKTIFLCEVSYEKDLKSLVKRLQGWHKNWDQVREAIVRDSLFLDMPIEYWPIRPWLFIRSDEEKRLDLHLKRIASGGELQFKHKVTHLEKVLPWLYRSWDRLPDDGEASA